MISAHDAGRDLIIMTTLSDKEARLALLKKHLVKGDYILHTRALGRVQEHTFVSWDGLWIIGRPTSNTITIEKGIKLGPSTIHPMSVTHINREPIANLEVYSELKTDT
jgi:hypothetical protein